MECEDLEGVNDLIEEMRPVPSQKPHRVVKTTENSEETRLLYVKLLEVVICQEYELDHIRYFVNDIVNITRTLCMDPCVDVVLSVKNIFL